MKNIGRIIKNTSKSILLTSISVFMIELVIYFAYTTSVAGNLTKGQFIKTNILVFVGCFVLYIWTAAKACSWSDHSIDIFISGVIVGFIFLPIAHQVALFLTHYEWIFPTQGIDWSKTHVIHDPELFNRTLWSVFTIPYGLQLLISSFLAAVGTTSNKKDDHKSEPNM